MSETVEKTESYLAEAAGISVLVNGLTKTYNIYPRPVDRMMRRLPWWPTNPKQVHAVRDVNFQVHRGETLGIIGRNGSGKSTLLEMIVGTLAPDLGSVEVRGRISALLELGAGFDMEFTGRENLYLNAHLLGFSRDEIEHRVPSILEFSELGDFIDQPVKTYSSGMFVRLAFAVAISVDPDILIIDEALAVGDAAFQRKCFARIEKLKEGGATILFVSHSERMLLELCDRALLMHQGHQLMLGTPKDVVSAYHRVLFDPDWAAEATDPEAFRSRLGRDGIKDDQLVPLADTRTSRSHFDPSLVSKSRFEYENQGATLHDPMVLDQDGEQVNMLRHGDRYTYTYEISFHEDSREVRCGMLIKTVTGLELTSCGTTSRRQAVAFVPAGSTLTVSFAFTCSLLADDYFFNCGVSSVKDGARDFMHRIIDAVMIKVMPEPSLPAGHIVDLEYAPRVRLSTPDGEERMLVRDGVPVD
ncbi:MAG: ABC transporter ATP-binding protein [Rhodospirillaceae bacterium]|nr:ABC transporter ATP-binding protein [Rhodospirillaceae bacterium]MBT6137776.1 ABC transporter ATP-binding protein [Rhodospirillaceae bacterium]